MSQEFDRIKLVGGKANGIIFKERLEYFKMDRTIKYQIGYDFYIPYRIEDGCLILRAQRGYLN